jgi:hypothetical protein
MRLELHRGLVAGLVVLVALGLAGCSDGSESSDEASTTAAAPSTSTTMTTSTVPRSTTSVLPACSTIDPGISTVHPAAWLPADVPEDWQLQAAATVQVAAAAGTPRGTWMVLTDEQGTITGEILLRPGSAELQSSDPIQVRGSTGQIGSIGGRSVDAMHERIIWDEDGTSWTAAFTGADATEVAEALASVDLSSGSAAITDPTAKLVAVAVRPDDSPSELTVLTYDVSGGTAWPTMGGSGMTDTGSEEPPPTDVVEVIIERFSDGGSGVSVQNGASTLGELVGLRIDGSGPGAVLRGESGLGVPMVMAAATAASNEGSDAGSTPPVAVSVAGAPSVADADRVVAAVQAVDPDDPRLATATVRIGILEMTACLPD